jgi:hypothetical protein
MAEMTQAAIDVLCERRRQVQELGWTHRRDDSYKRNELSAAAACFTVYAVDRECVPAMLNWLWPWAKKWRKPRNRRKALVKAGALILAEIERLDRAKKS